MNRLMLVAVGVGMGLTACGAGSPQQEEQEGTAQSPAVMACHVGSRGMVTRALFTNGALTGIHLDIRPFSWQLQEPVIQEVRASRSGASAFFEVRDGRREELTDARLNELLMNIGSAPLFATVHFTGPVLRYDQGGGNFVHVGAISEVTFEPASTDTASSSVPCEGVAQMESGQGASAEFTLSIPAEWTIPDQLTYFSTLNSPPGASRPEVLTFVMASARVFEVKDGAEVPLRVSDLPGRDVRVHHTAEVRDADGNLLTIATSVEAL